MQDKTITCRDCGQQFTFSGTKQQQYTRQGLSDPTRCPFCEVAHQAATGSRPTRADGGERHGSAGATGDRQTYVVFCSRCGKRTQVPFEPRPGRPVLCSSCYQERQSSSGGYGGGASARDREDRNRRRR